MGVLLPDLDGGLQPQHVVDGALGQTDRAGDGGADDILPAGAYPLWPCTSKLTMRLPSV